MSSDSKNAAIEYILDPINGPDPSDETGLNSSFHPDRVDSRPTDIETGRVIEQSTGKSTSTVSTNPFRNRANSNAKTSTSVHSRPVSVLTDPFADHGVGASASTNPFRDPARSGENTSTSRHSRAVSGASNGSTSRHAPVHRTDNFPELDGVPARRSGEASRSSAPRHSGDKNRSRRSSSLRERYPGDPSVNPLDQIAREAKLANRSPHLKKKHIHGTDSIDKLDDGGIGAKYHHEGPYDAASFARNNSFESAPIEALKSTNAEALKATPADKIRDSLNDRRPLDGTAIYPPGSEDPIGRTYDYEEGTDMMREGRPEGGAYKRYEGIDYLPEDLKGKGEPSYSLDKLEKENKGDGKPVSGAQGIELVERPRSGSKGSPTSRFGEGIKKRVGSLRKKDK